MWIWLGYECLHIDLFFFKYIFSYSVYVVGATNALYYYHQNMPIFPRKCKHYKMFQPYLYFFYY